MPLFKQRKLPKVQHKHPYLSGNFAPIKNTLPLTPCTHEGVIPQELAGGEYIRNGGNPVSNDDLGRDAHWFDGDGMLSGVSFRKQDDGEIQPEFVNQYLLTDIFLSASNSKHLRSAILPSIATLVNPFATFISVTLCILRTVLLVVLSHLPGSIQAIKKISVANTSILYHDGRALATCESGPPLRVSLPGLETVGWFNGHHAEGEPGDHAVPGQPTFGGEGILSFMREWATAHPKVDSRSKEMILFHSSFLPPFVRYSIVPATSTWAQDQALKKDTALTDSRPKMVNLPVPGISSAKMMHDFGVSIKHTVIMDLPLSLDPFNMLKNQPVIEYDSDKPSRFGVFPRHRPGQVKFFETKACCIFHTANTWDSFDTQGNVNGVHMLACRLTSSTLVYAAGNLEAPKRPIKIVKSANKSMPFFQEYDTDFSHRDQTDFSAKEMARAELIPLVNSQDLESPRIIREPLIRLHADGEVDTCASYFDDIEDFDELAEEDQCRLYHYHFSLETGKIASQYALSVVPFEFPSVNPDFEMQDARYVYGCSTTVTSFGAALGKAAKIDALVKMDAKALIEKGESMLERGQIEPIVGCVDRRSVADISAAQNEGDPIKVFRMPAGWYAQEPRFVPRSDATTEDDGYLLTYAFDEAQLNLEGEVPSDDDSEHRAKSELWIIDAKDMKTIVGRIHLPQRVPYGLHGAWFSEAEVQGQRAIEQIRTVVEKKDEDSGVWMSIRERLEKWLS